MNPRAPSKGPQMRAAKEAARQEGIILRIRKLVQEAKDEIRHGEPAAALQILCMDPATVWEDDEHGIPQEVRL